MAHPYSTLDELKKEIPEQTIIELTDDDNQGVINETNLDGCREKGDNLIDSYCGQVAEVPFATVPGIINAHSLTLWIYHLYSRRSVAPEVRKNYEDVISHLKSIVKGEASLPPVTEAETPSGTETQISSGRRIFTRDKLKGF